MEDRDEVTRALARLEQWFREVPGLVIAYSGGVDSALVAFLAKYFLGQDRTLAVLSASPSLSMPELDHARAFARTHGIPLQVIVTREMDDPNYTSNPANRCYFCKTTLYQALNEVRTGHPEWWVANGQNTDDLGDYRPGLLAAKEQAIRAPLGECGINKGMVRALAEQFSLDCWNKPASPCLASRVPYGQAVTPEKLRQIEAAESILVAAGFPVCRVRHLGDTARLEVPPDLLDALRNIETQVSDRLIALGFSRVEIDPEGFVSGKLNRALRDQGSTPA